LKKKKIPTETSFPFFIESDPTISQLSKYSVIKKLKKKKKKKKKKKTNIKGSF
jgi:hypothetical protein